MKEILTIILCFILFVGIVLAILFHEQVDMTEIPFHILQLLLDGLSDLFG